MWSCLINKLKGVELGDADIQVLFFADDIVLLAENEENLRELMSTSIAFLDELRLDLNQSKSKIRKMGRPKGKILLLSHRKRWETGKVYTNRGN